MKCLIVTLGSSGDVHPFIAVGMALKRRGHQVTMLVNPYYESQVLQVGLDYLPLGEHFELSQIADTPDIMNKRRATSYLMNHFLLPNLTQVLDAVKETLQRDRPDVILAHQLCFGVPWIGEQQNIPCVTTVLSPLLWFSGEEPNLYRWWEPTNPPRWYCKIRKRLVPFVLRMTTDKALNRIRSQYGMSRRRNLLLRDTFDNCLTLGLWSKHFRGPLGDDPANGKICGFAWFDRHTEKESGNDDLDSFLDEGEPPIIFTLGSTAVHVAGSIYEQAAEACQQLGRRGLLLTGTIENAPKNLPPGVRAFGYAPFSTTLARGCATVHHGGVGTTAQAMRAGKPMVIIPFAHDQFDNAARVNRMGISATVQREKVSAASLSKALSTLLDDPVTLESATRLGHLLADEDGADVAAQAMEEITSSTVTYV